MIIICGYSLAPEADRDGMVESFGDMVRRCRAFDGCVDVSISADPIDPRRINNLEVWRDAEALEAWRAVANAPEFDVEFEAVEMKRYDAVDGGPLFPEAED